MKNIRSKKNRPAGVSLAAAIWAVFFGTIVVYNTRPFPEPFSAARAAAVGIAAAGLLVLLSFLRGRKWSWTTLLVLGIAGSVITLWVMLLGWLYHNPIPIGISAALLSTLLSTLLLLTKSTRVYCASITIRKRISEDFKNRLREEMGSAAGGYSRPGIFRGKKLSVLITVFLVICLGLVYIYSDLAGDGGDSALEDEMLLPTRYDSGRLEGRPRTNPLALLESYDRDLKLGIDYYQKKAWLRAVPFLWRATIVDPHRADTFFYLGESLGCLKKIAKEAYYLRKAISLRPLVWQFHGLYVSSSYFVREDGRSWQEYRILKELNPDRAAEFLTWIQREPRREPIIVQGQFYIKQAAYFYRKFLRTLPTKPGLLDAAYRLGLKRIPDGCERKYLDAIKDDPRDSRTHCILGYLYYRQRDLERSIDYFRKAENLGFKNQVVYYWLGLAYLENGDPWPAIIQYDYLRRWKNQLAKWLFERLYPV